MSPVITMKTRVVIVGAGPSGAAAADRLLSSGFSDFVILEARNRIGGRIHSFQVGKKHLELGAQWIHGEEGNVAYEIAAQQNLVYDEDVTSSSSDDEDASLDESVKDLATSWREVMFITSDGVALPENIAMKMGTVTARLEADEYGKITRFGNCMVKSAGQSYIACLDALLDGDFADLKPWRDPFLDWVNRYMNSVDGSDSWWQVSPTYTYHRCPGNPSVSLDPRKGYKSLVEHLLRDVASEQLLLEKEVVAVDYTDDREIKIFCRDGSQFLCERCLITLPLGVLRHPSGPKFTPVLPKKKTDALNALGFGVVNKIFLKFRKRWWPVNAEDGFSLLWTDETDKEFQGWPRSLLGFYVDPVCRSVLCGWISGDGAREMETTPLDEVQRVCIQVLRKFTRNLGVEVPDPLKIYRSSWSSDPFARGSYSFRTVECDEKSLGHVDLKTPVPNERNPRVFFAGEATHPNFYSTVHGAISSGHREAEEILKSFSVDGKRVEVREPEFHQVVIVGAGVAGLAAADTLYRNGLGDVVVLEAQDRVGGRVWTISHEQSVIELGAQWIHGEKGNPLFDFSMERNLIDPESLSYEAEGKFYTSRGEEVAIDLVEKGRAIIQKAYRECNKFSRTEKHLWGEELPSSVGAFFEQRFFQKFDKKNHLHQGLLEWFMLYEKIDNACDSMFELSPISWGEWFDCEGEWHVNLKNGYESVIAALIEGLKPGLHSPVKNLSSSARSPEIRLCEPAREVRWLPEADLSADGPLVHVATEGGKVYSARHVIVTSSLGFLKENLESFFVPGLPPKVELAIKSLGFGVINKIFVTFPQPFWEDDCRGIHLIWTELLAVGSTMRDSWMRGISGFDLVVNQPNTLVCWIGGEEARFMETLTEEDLKDDIWILLKQFTGNVDIPEPVSIHRSKWFSNPYVRGSYSHRNLHSDTVGVKATDLAEPAFCCDTKDPSRKVPVVMLAGEAQHLMYYSTVHGAFEAGQEVARGLAQHLLRPVGTYQHQSSSLVEKQRAMKPQGPSMEVSSLASE